MTAVASLLDELRAAREYTNGLLDHVPDGDWYRMPAEGVTHIAWQVGHLAWAELGLCLVRVCGMSPEEISLLPKHYGELFGKGSVPRTEDDRHPEPAELRAAADRVHAAALEAVSQLDDSVLDEPAGPPHLMFTSKREALRWCAHHELTHTGQIILLRRLLGHTARR
ncbi:DinB superfamily protein [Maioricimonas rarisocia]|uniref:DinB superfamily protein n=1 Tax=Maioricimonas rarisocia TaxID=2528026 RepID=A0A517ZG04_9PLAN|nr:DinB family protein [Maioricimonas rarisocia]QDU41405.1 DinB superfamily protein [Maioricimonas rarisocia]